MKGKAIQVGRIVGSIATGVASLSAGLISTFAGEDKTLMMVSFTAGLAVDAITTGMSQLANMSKKESLKGRFVEGTNTIKKGFGDTARYTSAVLGNIAQGLALGIASYATFGASGETANVLLVIAGGLSLASTAAKAFKGTLQNMESAGMLKTTAVTKDGHKMRRNHTPSGSLGKQETLLSVGGTPKARKNSK